MNVLIRIFYTVLSMSVMTAMISPIILLVRYLLQRREKRYVMWEWRLVYFRAICPVALSSPLCIIPAWNRSFHLCLSQTGLTLTDSSGIMHSWRAAFQGRVEATRAFQVCSIIWIVGVFLVLLSAVWYQHKLSLALRYSRSLGEEIYESSLLQVPVRLGWYSPKICLPPEMSSSEVSWLLRHMENHKGSVFCRAAVTLISAVHWFNPVIWLYYYLWSIDEELDKDQRLVCSRKPEVIQSYAQAILNFKKNIDAKIPFSLLSIYERKTEKRAYRMMYQKWDTPRQRRLKALGISCLAIWLFLLVPLYQTWMDRFSSNGTETSEEQLFETGENFVVAKTDTHSPEGLDRLLQLEMLSGTEDESGYTGSFQIVMYDSIGNKIASVKLKDIFPEMAEDTFYFSKNLILCVQDYNDDGTQELSLGQEQDLSQEEFEQLQEKTDEETGSETAQAGGKVSDYQVYSYSLLNIENEDLKVLCDAIYVVTEEGNQKESKNFTVPEDTQNLFQVSFSGTKLYYIWREDAYEPKALSKKELKAYQDGAYESEGETQEHSLEDSDGTTQVLVSTKTDSTGSEEIQSIKLAPRANTKTFEDVQGYYCDLYWVTTSDEETERYAMIIYNGTKAQTFIIYDTKKRTVYYRHEDDTQQLQTLFKQYGEEEITFEENNTVIYSVSQKEGDILSISFAASADNDITVSGSYDYDVKEKTSKNLSFSRTTNESATATPAGEE